MPTTVEQLRKVVALLRHWGHRVTLEPGWATRCGKRSWTPCRAEYGVEHWTASPRTSTAYLRDGDPHRGLGTLCNVQVKRDGTLHLIAGGYTNHAGYVDAAAPRVAANPPMSRDAVPGPDSRTYSANGAAIGMEGNAGPGHPYTPAMHTAATAWWAACTIVFGWRRDAPPILGHKEITRRKPGDPAHDMAARRRAVAELITRMTTTVSKEDDMQLTDRVRTSWGTVSVEEALAAAAEIKMAPTPEGAVQLDHLVAEMAARLERIEGALRIDLPIEGA